MLSSRPLLQVMPQPGRNARGGEDEDPVEVRALGADGLDVALELFPQPLPLDGAGEHDDVGGGQGNEPDRERQLAGQVGTEGLEVTSLISASRYRPGGRKYVAGDAPFGHLPAQVLERVVLVVRGHASQGEPD